MTEKKKKRLTKKEKKQIELTVIITIAVISILLWDTIFIYPVKMFIVMLHEMSHGLAVLFTGGSIEHIQFSNSLAGECVATGGNKFITASAGYLGSLLFGSALFFSAYNRKRIQITNVVIACLIIIFATNFFIDPANIIFALLSAVILFVSPKYFPAAVNSYLMKTLGLISSLYVLTDIKEDLITLTYRQTDAQILSDLTSLPAIFWGAVWFIITGTVVFFLFRYAYREGIKY